MRDCATAGDTCGYVSVMVDGQDELRDLAALVVPRAGALHETGDLFEPYRVVDGDGVVVLPAVGFLRDLQAAGRSAATQRSYACDLLRWFRFCWAVDVPWGRATRVEARDFCCWIQSAAKPARGGAGGRAVVLAAGTPNAVTGKPSPGLAYATATVLHCETVLRGFYEYHLRGRDRAHRQPVPARPAGRAGARSSQSDGAVRQGAGGPVPAAAGPPGPAAYP